MSSYLEQSGFPGLPPFTRGVYPDMYAGRPWTMRQYSGYATAEETNKRYKILLERGQTGLSVAFDLPTQMGYDSSDPMSAGEVGKAGVAIDTLADMEILFDGIDLSKVSVSMTINATAAIILAMVIATAEKQGLSPEKLSGTVQNDILKEFIARGCYIFPPEPSLKLAIDIFEHSTRHMPKWNCVSISGYHIREAGSTAVQELGFTLANGIAYLEESRRRGLDLHAVGQRISFFFNAHNNFIEEIAKFRAARRLWYRIMKERFQITDDRASLMRFHVQTAGCTLTAQQPENNVTRVALQAMAAVLGGAQSLHTNAKDEALALPTEQAATLALRTQQIIANETDILRSIDPFGGSTTVEERTDRLEHGARELIQEIDRRGGALTAIRQRYIQTEIERSALTYQRGIEEGTVTVVGLNRFRDNSSRHTPIPTLKIDRKSEEAQIKKLSRVRKKRDPRKVEQCLGKLGEAARSRINLMPPIIACVKEYVSLGEICTLLRSIYGQYNPYHERSAS